jgi:hypothetical protein
LQDQALSHVVDLLTAGGAQTNSSLVSAYRQRAEIEQRMGQPAQAKDDATKAVDVAKSCSTPRLKVARA